MKRECTSAEFGLGSKMPEFSLKNVNEEAVSNGYFEGAKARLVVFTCNHCPYVKGSDRALNEVVDSRLEKGLSVVAISSNDAVKYPDDSFEKMQEKHKSLKLKYPYLYDESQEVARSFDAACTPECYLFNENNELVFHGTINDSPSNESNATKPYLATAIDQLLAGKKPEPSYVHPIGCSIKWKL